jgi:hypothetical protein
MLQVTVSYCRLRRTSKLKKKKAKHGVSQSDFASVFRKESVEPGEALRWGRGSISLGASLPEDGKRVGFRKFVCVPPPIWTMDEVRRWKMCVTHLRQRSMALNYIVWVSGVLNSPEKIKRRTSAVKMMDFRF